MNRRRFLALSAAALAAPAGAQTRWQGRAFGADCTLTLSGPARQAEAALSGLPALIETIEAEFSLHRPSALTRLNATGQLDPSPAFRAVMRLCDAVHRLTAGAFDPTVQVLWQAAAEGRRATGPVGWEKLGQGRRITLQPGMALTFNGIAQGFGADAVKAHLAACGFDHALIDMGETAALGGPFRLGLHDPTHGQLATRTLTGTAIATSSPRATLVNGQPHILHPQGLPPLWSTVSVEATSAALADALSTGLVFLTAGRIAALRHPGLIRVTLIDPAGNLTTL
ncbi:FAD:protein FMN transferase [Rhodobacter calidifons]|uniref:FAD:protein FMN transferase n=1 Tax=Rhodobacter calidifons TaxID=2715277 RepID=A0ABX0GCZ2_9RHOB|nr:FAD:protein FMN transferase [Rhodobacter calidifons]NHB78582.1 FAD:protein FMN transferase [Rhodobacter calidifons]